MYIIGENIHIISPKVKEAIAARDGAFFVDLARKQVQNGAKALDLNVGPQKKAGTEVVPWLVEVVDPAAASLVNAPECRLPEHGIELWTKTQIWIADSSWRKDGTSPAEFCGVQSLTREAQHPDRTIMLTDIPPEHHKAVRRPFKQDYYRYICVFEDRWKPIYKLAPNEKCKQ